MRINKADSLGNFYTYSGYGGELKVFFSNEYSKYISDEKNDVIYLFSTSYVVPVLISRRFIFIHATFLSEPAKYSEISETEETFIEAVFDYFKTNEKVQWMNPTPASAFFKSYPKKSHAIPFGSHVIDLSQSEAELFSNLHTKHRNGIRKAEKDNVIVKCGGIELLDDYCKLDEQTWKRSNRNGNEYGFYVKLILSLNDTSIIYIAYKDDVPQSGGIFFYNSLMSYYMYGASCNHPYPGSGNLLHWVAIKEMKKKGVLHYSFVGCRINEDRNSKYHEIQRFKERFGGKLIEGYMYKINFNPFYHFIYNILLLIKTKALLPKDAIDQEKKKWKQILK